MKRTVWCIFLLLAWCAVRAEGALTLESPAFSHNAKIPEKYTCQGLDINPTLRISGIPDGAKTLVLIVDDPDAPMGTWVHWVVYNISPTTLLIEENSVPGILAINDFRRKEYGGPCPPSGTHRYFFKLYALDRELRFPGGARKSDVEHAMQGCILDSATLIGLYKKY